MTTSGFKAPAKTASSTQSIQVTPSERHGKDE
jgi:hypothetical protein